MKPNRLSLSLTFWDALWYATAGKNSYNISGQLFCANGDNSYKVCTGQTLYLYDKDGLFNADDLLGQSTVDTQGRFAINGMEEEEETPEPYLYFFHICSWIGGYVKILLDQHTQVQNVTIYLDGRKQGAFVNGHTATFECNFG